MRPTPPPFALKLLELSNADSALVGDLMEECARGRSRAWYWKQVLNIAARQFFSDKIWAVRWLVALPAATLAAGLVPDVLLQLSRTAPLRSASSDTMILLTFFWMAAVLVGVAIWTAPDRKREVARLAVMVTMGIAVLFIASAVMAPNSHVRDMRGYGGVCFLLGGALGLKAQGLRLKAQGSKLKS